MTTSHPEQMDLLSWTPPRGPAKVLAFPLHRSHGATAVLARNIVDLRRPDRTGRLNTLRNQTRKRLEPFIGKEAADHYADQYVRTVRAHFGYLDRASDTSSRGPDGGPRAA